MKIFAFSMLFLCPLFLSAQEDEAPGTIRIRKAAPARDSTAPQPRPLRARDNWSVDTYAPWHGVEAMYGIANVKQIFRPQQLIDGETLNVPWIMSYMISSREFFRPRRRAPIRSSLALKTGISVIRFRDYEDIGIPLLLEFDQLRFGGFGLSFSGGMRIMEGTEEKMTWRNALWVMNKYISGEIGVGIACDPFRSMRTRPCPVWKSFLTPLVTCSWRRVGAYQFRAITLDFQFYNRLQRALAAPRRGNANDLRDGF